MGIQEELADNRRERRELAARIAELDAALEAGLVKRAFDEGMTGPQIATVLGVSKPRVYQIRDGRR